MYGASAICRGCVRYYIEYIMKKETKISRKILRKITGAILLLFVAVPSLHAQADAGSVLQAMAAAVKGLGNYTVSFRVTAEGNSAAGEYTVSGSRYYMSMGDIEIYSDGRVRYEVDHFDEEVLIDRVDPNDRNILSNPTRAFDFAEDSFISTYKGVMNESGRQYDVVELKPRDSDASVRNIELTVDKTTRLPHSISYLADGISGFIIVEVLRIGAAPNVPESLFSPDMSNFGDYEIIPFFE